MAPLPDAATPVDRILRPFQRFAEKEAAGGIVLLLAAAIAMVWANSPLGDSYAEFWQTRFELKLGAFELRKPIVKLVNDGLMAIFFFVVGMEIKRELLYGELSSRAQVLFPLAAAAGGMLAPAAFYLAFNTGGPGAGGWGIPMATDIAFALGVLSLFGPRVPLSLKVFLTALAIFDDIGAVVVIAAFYSSDLAPSLLLVAGALVGLAAAMNLLGFRRALPYGIVGVLLWIVLLRSGVHTTVGGVLLALTIPSRRWIDPDAFVRATHLLADRFAIEQRGRRIARDEGHAVFEIEHACNLVQPPLQRFEHALLPWAAFGIMPLFALANAGVRIESGVLAALGEPVTLGILAGLVVGKPIGVLAVAWLAVRLRLARLPDQASWRQIAAVGCLCGIGFTMSLFIAGLGFDHPDLERQAKVGILVASTLAALLGALLMPRRPYAPAAPP
jgi:NhaA family Na+:H+ antiporter